MSESKLNPADLYPGVAPDCADDERVEKGAVKKDVKELNDNPRDTDNEMP